MLSGRRGQLKHDDGGLGGRCEDVVISPEHGLMLVDHPIPATPYDTFCSSSRQNDRVGHTLTHGGII